MTWGECDPFRDSGAMQGDKQYVKISRMFKYLECLGQWLPAQKALNAQSCFSTDRRNSARPAEGLGGPG